MDSNSNLTEMQPSNSQPGTFRLLERFDPAANPDDNNRLNWLWSKVSTQDYAFDDNSRGNPEYFLAGFLDPYARNFIIQDKAWITVRNVFLNSDANIHFCTWDRTLEFSDIISAGREALNYLFNVEKVQRVTGMIPEYNKLAKRFATLSRFKYEGEMRHNVLFKGVWYNTSFYGLLRDEFNKQGHKGVTQ